MKKKISALLIAAVMMLVFGSTALAADYVARPGDSLWLIAQKYNITLQQLLAANPQITDPEKIYVGQVIVIPGHGASPQGRESLTYLYAGNTASYMKILDKAHGCIGTVCPDYFDIRPDGSLWITPSDKIDDAFIKTMHSRGILVTPFISNHWDRPLGVAALANRAALADQLAAAVKKHDLDGLNVDIENVSESQRAAYTDFVRLLRQKLPADKILTVAVAANPKGWNTGWHGSYDYKALAGHCDYLMLMCYDESYNGSPPGPVSSSSFFEGSIKYALNQGVPKEKIVAGLPFYGRFWKEGAEPGGIAVTARDVEYLLKNYTSQFRYDTASQSANAQVTIGAGQAKPIVWGGRILGEGKYNIWYDNAAAVDFKLRMIDRYDLRGAGSWALGQEDPDIWSFYSASLNGGGASKPETPPQPPSPENPQPVIERILKILKDSGSPRALTANSPLTRGEIAVILAEWTWLAPEPAGEAFPDTGGYWGEGWINALKRRGILRGTEDGRYHPGNNISREEIVTIFDRLLVLPNTVDFHEASFKDVPPSRWSYAAVAKMYYFNVIKGYDQHSFGPLDPINVTTMAIILDRIERFDYPLNPDKFMPQLVLRSALPAAGGSKEALDPELKPNFKEPVIDPR
ncbi:MAG: glycosyl hydrolase family 18 protein [Clostridiales bacterium]|nr:glycosyl hydrolase family 18 protein [Clostridiales bacterium]